MRGDRADESIVNGGNSAMSRLQLFVGAVVGLIATSVCAAPPAANVLFSIDSGPAFVTTIAGTAVAGGNQSYVANYADTGGAWTLSCTISADYMANPQAGLVGIITYQNLSASTQTFSWALDVQLCRAIHGASMIGGTGTLTLTTVGPGTVSCLNNVPLLRAVADGSEVGSMFLCPMNLGSSGSGTATVNSSFGTPVPALAGPTSINVIGQREQFTITAGDKVKFQFVLVFKDTTPETCAGDLNGDAIVNGMDLSYLLYSWGNTSPCSETISGDIDGNGAVDATDLTTLLTNWGSCAG